jgi:catalase
VTHDVTRFTEASVFSKIGKRTDVFVRFSTVAGERGAADVERDIRGFAIRFYTNEGNRATGTSGPGLPSRCTRSRSLMSDRGIPRSYREMHGFGRHTFSLISAASERTCVKFTLRTQQGIANLSDSEAQEIIGRDRESAILDLYEHIKACD